MLVLNRNTASSTISATTQRQPRPALGSHQASPAAWLPMLRWRRNHCAMPTTAAAIRSNCASVRAAASVSVGTTRPIASTAPSASATLRTARASGRPLASSSANRLSKSSGRVGRGRQAIAPTSLARASKPISPSTRPSFGGLNVGVSSCSVSDWPTSPPGT